MRLAPGEGRKVLAIVVAVSLFAHVRRKELRKRWLKDEEPTHPNTWDHPALTYLLENAIQFGLPFAAERWLPLPAFDRRRPLSLFFRLFFAGVFMVDTGLVLEKLMCMYAYRHVPYFSGVKPPGDFKTVMMDYLNCNFPASIINVVVQMGLVMALSKDAYKKVVDPEPVRVLPFLVKLLVARLAVDISFGVAHNILHTESVYWLHKRHHEHVTPRTQTNLHFHFIDLMIEAIFPLYVAAGTLHLLGIPPTRWEQVLAFSPLIYYESASHSGKEMPVVSWFPPLGPVVHSFTGCDDRVIEYHTIHHMAVKCNYSISPMTERLLLEPLGWGRYKMELPGGYAPKPSHD